MEKFSIKIRMFLICRSRGIASGAAAAINYILGFITKKIYYNLETTLSLPGVSLFYSVICGTGMIVMFFILPETEDRTLEDIESHFADGSKAIIDRKIVKKIEMKRIRSSNGNQKDGMMEEAKPLTAF